MIVLFFKRLGRLRLNALTIIIVIIIVVVIIIIIIIIFRTAGAVHFALSLLQVWSDSALSVI